MTTAQYTLTNQDVHILTDIINTAWMTNIPPNTMQRRVNSGATLFIARDTPNETEREHFRLRDCHGTIPIGIIETIDIKTGGSYDKVPKTYDELTNNGLWRPPTEDSDTLILVDVTLLSTRRGGDAGRLLMEHALKDIAQTDYKYIWTYTPNIEKVKEWHKKLGATDTKYIIKNARPLSSYPDVNIMQY